MRDPRGLAVHQRRRVIDDAAEVFADRLQPQANPEQRTTRRDRPTDRLERLARALRPARPRPDADRVVPGDQLRFQTRIVVADDVDVRAERTEKVR